MWVLTVLQAGPHHAAHLLDDVRSVDGPMGHGTLFAALARLECLALVDTSVVEDGRRAYQLTALGAAAFASVAALRRGVGR
jgi:DNA-binding PadR family transcriptional regulator